MAKVNFVVENGLVVKGNITSNGGIDKLTTSSGSVNVSGAAAPIAGQVLTASGPTTASWASLTPFAYPSAGFVQSNGSAWLSSVGSTGTGNVVLASGATISALDLSVTNTITGNISGNAATVTAAAQPAITSVGTLTGLTVSSTINGSVSGSAATVTGAAQGNITSVGVLTSLVTSGNVTVGGDLFVLGNTTTIDSQTLTVTDANITLGNVAVPSDATAVGGGIILLGSTNKTLQWNNATNGWQSSESIDIASGKTYQINGVGVLSATTLGTGVVNSSLTSVGTLTNLTVTNPISGNVTGSAATVTSAAQPAITSVGTLTGLTVTATITGNISGSAATVTAAAQPAITSVGTLSGLTVTATITGNISGSAATVTAAAQPAITSVGTLTGLNVNGNIAITGGGAIKANETGTSFGTSPTTIDSFDITLYRSAKYIVSVTNGSTYQVSEVLLTQDGTTAYSVGYGEVSTTGTPFVSFSSTLGGGFASLQATGLGAGNVAKVLRTYIAV